MCVPGLLHPGDLLVEVNGKPVVGMEPEQVIQILVGHLKGKYNFFQAMTLKQIVHNIKQTRNG